MNLNAFSLCIIQVKDIVSSNIEDDQFLMIENKTG